METETKSCEVLLLISPQCHHCHSLIKIFAELVKSADIAGLQVFNLVKAPQLAEQYRVKSVPWFRIHDLEFEGAMSEGEIRHWLELDGQKKYMEYFTLQLQNGRMDKVKQYLQSDYAKLRYLVEMAVLDDQDFSIRLGISAVMEDLQGSEVLKQGVDYLAAMTRHERGSVRGDGAYYLGLSGNISAKPILQQLLRDGDKSVQEIAQESLLEIGSN